MILRSFINNDEYNKFKLNIEKNNDDIDSFNKRILYEYIALLSILISLFIIEILPLYMLLISVLLLYPIISYSNYLYSNYKEDNRQNIISNYLPDFLSQASLFPKGTDITTIIEFASRQDFGPLSKEFMIATDQIKKGFMVETALKEITYRNDNKFLRRTINILIIAYNSGKDLSPVFEKIGKDIEKTKEIEQDKYSALAMQKYTLIISCAFLIPLVMAWIVNVVSTINLDFFSSSQLLNSNNDIKEYAILAIKIYLAEFVVISSIFISIIDGNYKKFIIYSIILTPIAYTIFLFV